MKYTVAWVEIHQETVEAKNEDEAEEFATKNRTSPTYYTIVDALTKVEIHNPANRLAGRLSGMGDA